MKKVIIWIGVVAILFFMVIRIFTGHVDGVREEKVKYLSELDFDFSGEVDSTIFQSRVLFHVTHGRLDSEREREMAKRLKFNGILELLLYRSDGKLDLLVEHVDRYAKGDSLYLNSEQKMVRFYRKGKLIGESDLTKSLRGRPF